MSNFDRQDYTQNIATITYTDNIEVAMFPTIYKYFIGIGLMLFGLFALYFPEYQHPIYGHINLGRYRVFIGIVSEISGVIYTGHITYNK